MSTVAKIEFGSASDDNADYVKLIQDLKEWRAVNPLPKKFMSPANFAKDYTRYSGYTNESFRRRYYMARDRVKGQLFYSILFYSTVFDLPVLPGSQFVFSFISQQV